MLPTYLLRDLTAQTATQTADLDDGSSTTTWTDTAFRGRISRGRAGETTDDAGRQAGVSDSRLFTDEDVLAGVDRVVDGTDVWLLVGPPVAVWDTDSIHHYEAPLRKVDG